MTLPLATYEELHELIGSLCNGAIEPERFSRLQELLASDVEAQRLYLRYLDLHGVLHRLERGEAERGETNDECGMMNDELPSNAGIVPSLQPAASIRPSSFVLHPSAFASSYVGGVLFSYIVAVLILSVGLTIAWVWKLPDHSQVVRRSDSLPSPLSPRPSFVGRVTGVFDCTWSEPETAAVGSSYVPLGRRYALASGLLEITYDTGAKVILQGPCTYEVDSRTGGYLSVGKLTARVESRELRVESDRTTAESRVADHSRLSTLSSQLFSVRTPTAIVTDLGTEFGVEVSRDGQCDVHVFQGAVEAKANRDGTQTGSPWRVAEGQTVRIAGHDAEAQEASVVMVDARSARSERFVRDVAQFAATRVISVNFTHGEKSRLDETEQTGVIRAAHWNNADGSQTPEGDLILCDANGQATTARLSWTWDGKVTYPTWFSFDSPYDSREKLLDGHFAGGNIGGKADTALTIRVRGIPFAKYRVYVYFWMPPTDSGDDFHGFLVTVNDSSPLAIGRSRYDLNSFRQYRSRTDSGNYATIKGKQGDLALVASPDSTARFSTLFVAGLQIVGESTESE